MLRQLLWTCIFAIFLITPGKCWYPPSYDACDNSQCSRIQKILSLNVDWDVEPCDDFFKFSCAHSHISMNLMNQGTEIEDLEIILTSPNRTEDMAIDRAMEYEKKIYQQCMKSQDIYSDAAKSRYTTRVLEAHPVVRMNLLEDRDKKAWFEQDIDYAKKGFGFAFFEVDIVEIDDDHPGGSKYNDQYELYNYGRNKKRYIQIRPTADDIIEINNLLLTDYFDKHTQATNMKFEELKKFILDLNRITPPQYSSRDDYVEDVHNNRIKLSDWQNKYDKTILGYKPFKYDFVTALRTVFEAARIQLDSSEQIIIKQEEYFIKLTELFSQYHTLTIEKYIHLRYVSKTIGFVDERYKKMAIIPPIDGLKCTPGLFLATAHEYAKKYFSNYTRETAEKIFDNVKDFIEIRLKSGNYNIFVNENTKIFLRQLNRTKVIFGYPEWLLRSDMTEIWDNYFNSQSFNPESSTYYSSQVEAIKTLLYIRLKPYKEKHLPIIDLDVLYKSFSMKDWEIPLNLKQIIIPIRIFSENNYKFLSGYLLEPFNYGAFGSALASELYYTWLKKIGYDQNVNFCVRMHIADYADKIEEDITYFSRATSYVLGLQTAYKMFDTNPQRNFSVPIFIPDFGTEPPEVMFFISFGESLCRWANSRIDSKDKENFMNLAVSGMKEFSEAFTCNKARSQRLTLREKCNPLQDYGL